MYKRIYNMNLIDKDVLIKYGYESFRYLYLFYTSIKSTTGYVRKSINYSIGYVLGDMYKQFVFQCYDKKNYETFDVYRYKIIKDDKHYLFDYLVENSCVNKEALLKEMLNDTYENIVEKDKNKNMILCINLMLNDETILCDLLREISKLRYHFDCEKSDTILKWKHIYEIIKYKYTNDDNIDINLKNERLNYLNDINNLYIFMILNDDSLSEKVVMLSSVLDKYILFS